MKKRSTMSFVLGPVWLAGLLLVATLGFAACDGASATPTPTATAASPGSSISEPTLAVTPTATGVAPAPTATLTPASVVDNFRLLISDDRLAIGDFNKLLVTIEKVSVQQAGGVGLIEFDVPQEDNTADLTELQGDNALEVFKVQLEEGAYTGVQVHVGEVTGELAESGEPITLKLPSSKIKINKPFVIAEGVKTTFVFDIAVVAAGSEKSPKGIKYILLPVIGKSGADQPFKLLAAEAPTADAGEDQTVATGDTVQLDGSGSSDPEDDPLTYTWSLSAPDGSSATLSDATIVNPTFVADLGGKYVAALVVNDATSDSDPDSVEIEAEAAPNEPPTAEAGEDQTVATGDSVLLDGSNSNDPEGAPLTYSWALSTPEGSDATLSDATIVNPSFVADVDGEYIATLVVNTRPATAILTLWGSPRNNPKGPSVHPRLEYQLIRLAAPPGFEPGLTDSKSAVLPLHHGAPSVNSSRALKNPAPAFDKLRVSDAGMANVLVPL